MMADREKVYGFELCANGKPCIGEKFTSCPFSPRNNAEQNCGVTMARFALAMLKEQEAVEPKMIRMSEFGYPVNACGKCGHLITESMNYCSWCGRQVKWG